MFRGTIILILIFLVLSGCTNNVYKTNENIKYGVIYTSNVKKDSKIIFYSNDWKAVKEIDLKIGGLQQVTKYNEKLYVPVLGVPTSPDNKIMEVDLHTYEIRYINARGLPVKTVADESFLYVIHNTNIDYGLLTKVSIQNNTILNELKLNGVLRQVFITKDNVYVIGDNPKSHIQSIYKISKDFNKVEKIDNNQTAFPTDAIEIDGKILLINVAKNDFSGPTNEYIQLDSKTNTQILKKLQTPAPNKIFRLNEKILITHYNPPARNGNTVTILDNNLNPIETYLLENNLYRVIITDKKLVTLEENKIYEYNLVNFKLENIFEINKYDDKIISDIFIVENSF